jgi:hypothetical protein
MRREVPCLAIWTMVCQAQDLEGILVGNFGVEVAFKHISILLVEVDPASNEFYHIFQS